MAASPHDVESDALLVTAAQEGDADAFSELFRRHYQQVRRVCARKLRDISAADEIAQAAFVKAYERLDRCGGERRFGAWVQVIANNLCIDYLRAQARTTPTDEPIEHAESYGGSNPPEDALLHAEQAVMIKRALDTLPDRQRDVVVARDVDGRRPPEIAAALGLSLGAVDSLLLRARRRLAASMQSMTAESGAASMVTTAAVSAAGGAAANAGPLARVASAVGQAVAAASYHVAASLGMVPGMPSFVSQAAPAAAAGLVSLSPVGGALPHHHRELPPIVAPINTAVPSAPLTPVLGSHGAGVNTTVTDLVAPVVNQLPTAPATGSPAAPAVVPGAPGRVVTNVVQGVGAAVNQLLDGPAPR
ncbi:MAG: polymerase sigma-70 factor, subfamily [Actinomycetota bacterium]